MDFSDDSSRGSSSKSSSKSNRNGSEKGASSSKNLIAKKSCTVTSEQIEQFCAVTGSTKEIARNLIEACHGNLEMAVNMHMEGADNPDPEVVGAASEDYVRAPIPQKQEVLVQSGYEGYGFGFKGKRRIIKSVFDSFRNFEVETKLQESKFRETNGQLGAGTSTGNKRTLEELFRPPIDLMFNGNMQNARDAGKTAKKWVMVNVQNVSEFTCQVLNRDVWSHKRIKDLIKENFLFLQLYMDSEEGQRYMTFYKIKQWPYVAVLDPRTGELLVEWNHADSATYEALITEFVATTSWGEGDDDDPVEVKPPDAKKMRMDTILDASEDDQLQAAIRASLAAASRDNVESGSEEEDEEPSEWFDSESESRTSEPQSAGGSSQAVAEPPSVSDTDTTTTTTTDDDDWKQHLGSETDPVSSIVIRFPDGSREQKALPCTSTLTAIIKYIQSKGFPRDKFELLANFPKRELLAMDGETTLKEAGLFPQDTVFVQANR